MRSSIKAALAAALIGAAGSAASASVSVFTFNVTNNTGTPWTQLFFEIKAPLTAPYNPASLALVVFQTTNSNAHSTTKADTTIIVQESAKIVTFSFSELNRVQPGESNTFTVTVDNPDDSAFRIIRYATIVPAPSVAGLAGALGLAALRRRR